jgi:hypothetical protein
MPLYQGMLGHSSPTITVRRKSIAQKRGASYLPPARRRIWLDGATQILAMATEADFERLLEYGWRPDLEPLLISMRARWGQRSWQRFRCSAGGF